VGGYVAVRTGHIPDNLLVAGLTLHKQGGVFGAGWFIEGSPERIVRASGLMICKFQ
jgi:hypothetical protein